VLGVGYDQVERVLNGDMVLNAVVVLAVLKIVATAVCYASGNAGGIFGPSLFIGAMLGGAVGHIAHQLFPASTASAGAYALVGMGTAFAGIIRTPLTSVLMIFEVTRNYTIIVPLMISNLIAFYISQRLQREPIYEALARQDGLHLPTGAFRQLARQLRVSAALRVAPPPLAADSTLEAAQQRTMQSDFGSWPVVDEQGLAGMVRRTDIAAAVADGRSGAAVRELLDSVDAEGTDEDVVPHVHPDHPLGLALARMGATRHTVLPVVSRANVRTMLGIVTLADILQTYGVHSVEDARSRAENEHG
jgi:CIC family chloride channel protein